MGRGKSMILYAFSWHLKHIWKLCKKPSLVLSLFCETGQIRTGKWTDRFFYGYLHHYFNLHDDSSLCPSVCSSHFFAFPRLQFQVSRQTATAEVCSLKLIPSNICNFHVPLANLLKVSHCFLSWCKKWDNLRKS